MFVAPSNIYRVRMVMKSHENSLNLKMHFPGLEKSWLLGKMAEVMEKSCNFVFFSPNISSCLKIGNIPLVIEQ